MHTTAPETSERKRVGWVRRCWVVLDKLLLTPLDPYWWRYRAILLGLLLIPLNLYFLLYMEVATNMGVAGTGGGPYPSTISLFANAILFLVALTALNIVVKGRFPRLGLTRAELLVVYVMLTIATAIVSIDFLDVLVPMLTYPFRAASPENGWAGLIQPHIPSWISVSDPAAVKAWYEGGSTIWVWANLKPWVVPVGVWSVVVLAMMWVMFCINTIVRQQWIEHDKLQFPIVELPMQITEPGHRLLRSRLMWLGFSISAGISILSGLHALIPSVPEIPVKMWNLQSCFPNMPWVMMGNTPMSFYPYGIGLGYLLPLDMLFSCWFFFVMWRVIRIVGALYGVQGTTPAFPFMDQQALGAYYLIGIFALWSGRKHLARVWRVAFAEERDPDEANGPMRYRTAVVGLVLGGMSVVAFFHYIGLHWWIATVGIGLYFFLALAIARMHAEFGPPSHDLHYMGPEMIITGAMGTQSLGPGQLVGLSWFWWFNRAYRSIPIAYQLDGLKLAQRSNTSQRYMGLAIGVASLVAVVSGFLIYIHFGYTRGAEVQMAGHVSAFGFEAFARHAESWIKSPTKPDIPATLAIFWGMGFAYILYMLKLAVPWWPLHPLGFAVSTSYSIGTLWFPMFIAWAAKLITLKSGGMKTYRVALDFFLGLLLGDFIMGALWPVIGWVFGVSTYSFMQ